MSQFIFRKPMGKTLAMASCIALGLSFHVGANPVSHQPGQQFSALEWQTMGHNISREGDLIVLRDGNKLIGDIDVIPTIHYTFGDIDFDLRDVSLISFIIQDGIPKIQVITRDGLNYVGPITDSKIIVREHLPSLSLEPQSIERRLDPEAISFVALRLRLRDSERPPARVYQLTLQNGDQFPTVLGREEIHLSDGVRERVLQGHQFVEASFNGGLQGTFETDNVKQEIGFAFVKEPQLNLTIPNCDHCVEMPWEHISHFKVDIGDYVIAQTDRSPAELYYPEAKPRVAYSSEVAFDDLVPPVYKERELMSAATPESLRQGPRQAVVKSTPNRTDQMVLVPGGQFYVAIDDDVSAKIPRNLLPTANKPSFVIEISPFYVDKHEVTNGQYLAFIRATGHKPPQHWQSLTIPAGYENEPVVNVSYQDAAAYAAWAGKRLPSEVEWQRASEEASMMVAVEVERTQQHLGDQAFSILSLIAGFETLLAADESAITTFEYVMEDIGGRVAEWTSSSAAVDRSSPLAQVTGLYYTNTAKYGQHKVVRQGFVAENESVEYRSIQHQMASSEKIGFRCVSEVF